MNIVQSAPNILFIFVQLLAMFYFLLPIILHIANTIKRKETSDFTQKDSKRFSYAAIITAHQDLRFIPPFIDSLQKQEYQNFVAYIVADDSDISGIIHLQSDNIIILKPKKALHSKTSSIKHAIDHFINNHDILVIFDADNLLHPAYFKKLNTYFNLGYEAVQTHMLSKNINTPISKVDSIGHVYNNFLEREVKMNLGLHSAILGLGIAVKTEVYKKLLYSTSLGGFDKILQCFLAENTDQIAFAKDAIVYDEKIDTGPALEKQRTRWIFAYFKYFDLGWKLMLHGIRKMKLGIILLASTIIRPPLFLLMTIALCCMIIDFFVYNPLFYTWLFCLLFFGTNYILIVVTANNQKGISKGIIYIPTMLFIQIMALLKIKKAHKSFLQTQHEHIIFIDEILERDKANS